MFCRRHISVNTLLSPSSSVSSSTTLSRHQIVKVDNFLKLSLFPWICCSVSCVRFFATPWTVAHQAVHGDSSGKDTGVGCHALLQGIFPTQGSNPGLVHCRWILYHLNYQGSLVQVEGTVYSKVIGSVYSKGIDLSGHREKASVAGP